MAGWDTAATKSEFNANEQVNNLMAGRNRIDDYKFGSESKREVSSFEDATATDKGFWDFFNFSKSKEYSIVGIDGNQIGNMRSSIEDYVSGVQSYLEKAVQATEDQISGGLRGGEAEAAVKAYLDKVKMYVTNLVSTLNSFGDKLADVGNAWVQAQSNAGSNINTTTGAFSEGSAYTSQVQYKGPSR